MAHFVKGCVPHPCLAHFVKGCVPHPSLIAQSQSLAYLSVGQDQPLAVNCKWLCSASLAHFAKGCVPHPCLAHFVKGCVPHPCSAHFGKGCVPHPCLAHFVKGCVPHPSLAHFVKGCVPHPCLAHFEKGCVPHPSLVAQSQSLAYSSMGQDHPLAIRCKWLCSTLPCNGPGSPPCSDVQVALHNPLDNTTSLSIYGPR